MHRSDKLTVFISDLHLHPDCPAITERFDQFIDWAIENAKTVYILGDFFHAWPGDDCSDDWSHAIAARLATLHQNNVDVFFMHGNRDFLLGHQFFSQAELRYLPDPSIIHLNGEVILLSHGDRYCTGDHAHQWLRRLTRNRVFSRCFLKLPRAWRQRVVCQVRTISNAKSYHVTRMNVVTSAIINHLKTYRATTLIHGHTHKPSVHNYAVENTAFNHYILSDWDDTPALLCYDNSYRFNFIHM